MNALSHHEGFSLIEVMVALLILSIALVGSWAVDQAIENVAVTVVFGLLGYLMMRLDYPRLPMVIALVLGGGIERNFHQSLAMSDGVASIFVTRPLSATLCVLILLTLIWSPLRALRAKRGARLAEAA